MTGEISKPSAIDNGCSSAMKPPTSNGDHHRNKKKGDAFGLLKAAVLKLRQRPTEKPKSIHHHQTHDHDHNHHVDSEGKWNNLQDDNIPSPPPPSVQTMSVSTSVDSLEDMATPDSPSPSLTSNGTMSQYASALNLQELDKHEDGDGEDDPDEVFDAITGDEMIDEKADLFIAQFYQEMKLQQSNRTHRHHLHKGKNKA